MIDYNITKYPSEFIDLQNQVAVTFSSKLSEMAFKVFNENTFSIVKGNMVQYLDSLCEKKDIRRYFIAFAFNSTHTCVEYILAFESNNFPSCIFYLEITDSDYTSNTEVIDNGLEKYFDFFRNRLAQFKES